MSVPTQGPRPDALDGVAPLLARAAAADARARVRLHAAIDDVLTPAEARLDERTRVAIESALAGVVGVVEAELRQSAGRELIARDEPTLALALADARTPVFAPLREAGLLRDEDFLRELIARVQLELLAEALPAVSPAGEAPSLLARLVADGDRLVATAAVAVLVTDSRRKPGTAAARSELPADLHHKLVWWVAAALRDAHVGPSAALDRALTDASQASVSGHDSERTETVTMRLAAAIDAPASDLPDLLTDALGDRRAALFVALLAHALGIEFALVREIVLDPAGERLWLLLRALALPREAIARIGLALSDGDSRRDIEGFADALDTICAIDPVQARDAIAPLKLNRRLREALPTLARWPA